MKTRHGIVNALMLMVALSPIAYLLIVWDTLPETISIRFAFDEPTDVEQSKQAFRYSSITLSVTTAIIYFLMGNLQKIDPKVKVGQLTAGLNRLGLSITLFLVVLNYFLIVSAANSWDVSRNIIFMFAGLFIAVLGNYMNNVKSNFFAGIRLPWTLSNEDNWRQTHHLAGKLWFWSGIALAIISLLLPQTSLKPVFAGSLGLLFLIPAVYSYRLFRKMKTNNN